MDHGHCMDPSIDCWCKLCCQDSLGQLYILLGKLQKLELLEAFCLCSKTFWTYLAHIDCKGPQWILVDTCKLLCGYWLSTQLLESMDCCIHKDWHKLCFGMPEMRHIHHQMNNLPQWVQLQNSDQNYFKSIANSKVKASYWFCHNWQHHCQCSLQSKCSSLFWWVLWSELCSQHWQHKVQ